MTLRTARCHCRDLQLRCEGEPRKVSMCHCLDCQRRTGSLFSIAVFYERARVKLPVGDIGRYERDFGERVSSGVQLLPPLWDKILLGAGADA